MPDICLDYIENLARNELSNSEALSEKHTLDPCFIFGKVLAEKTARTFTLS